MARRRELPFDASRPDDAWRAMWDGPESAMAALMEAPPGAVPRASQEELLPLREVLADAIDELDARTRRAFEGCVIERKPLRALAKELGTTKSTVHRMKDDAIKQLREQLQSHPAIKEYLEP